MAIARAEEWYNQPEGTPIPDMPIQDAQILAAIMRGKSSHTVWKAVEVVLWAEEKFGEESDQVIAELGIQYDNLSSLRSDGKRLLPLRRELLKSHPEYQGVSFHYLRAVAPDRIPMKDKKKLTLKALEKGMDRDDFRHYVNDQFPAAPKIESRKGAAQETEDAIKAQQEAEANVPVGAVVETATGLPPAEMTAQDYGKIVAAQLPERDTQVLPAEDEGDVFSETDSDEAVNYGNSVYKALYVACVAFAKAIDSQIITVTTNKSSKPILDAWYDALEGVDEYEEGAETNPFEEEAVVAA